MSDPSYEPLEGPRGDAAIARVLERIPFYADQPRPPRVLRREDLLAAPPTAWVDPSVDLPVALASGAIRPLTTSGSTDEPLKVYADTTLSLPPGVWALHGLRDDASMVNLTSPVCLGASCPGEVARLDARVLLLTFRAGPFSATDAAITRASQAWNEAAADIAFVNPAWLHALLWRAARLGLTLHAPQLVVMTYQYPSRCQRRALSRAFPAARQVEFYGASEFGGTDLAIGCPEGHLHLVDYQVIAETLSTELDGHEELVFSTPLSRTMPLLRYAPGDLGRLGLVHEGACALWKVPTLELDGRVGDVMHGAHGTVTTRAFDDEVGEVDGLLFYAARSRAGAVSVEAVCEPGAFEAARAAVKGATAELGFSRCDVVERPSLALGASGKLRLTGEDDRHALDAR